jgi:hypothetical protein
VWELGPTYAVLDRKHFWLVSTSIDVPITQVTGIFTYLHIYWIFPFSSETFYFDIKNMGCGNNSSSLLTFVTLNYGLKNHLQPVSLNLMFVAAERCRTDERFWECSPSSISGAHSRLVRRPITQAVNSRHYNVWTRSNCQAFTITDFVSNSVWICAGCLSRNM